MNLFFLITMNLGAALSLSSSSNALPRIILASKSATRQLILKEMGFDFECMPADIDEKAIGDRLKDQPDALVLAIGRAKAEKVSSIILESRRKDDSQTPQPLSASLILAGDQVVTYQGEIREKPRDADECRAFIKSYAHAPCGTIGSVILRDLATGRVVEGVDSTEIHFDAIPDDVIETMIGEGTCLHCAGGLMIEHPLVQPYIKSVKGSIDSVMGLSKELVLRLVDEIGA